MGMLHLGEIWTVLGGFWVAGLNFLDLWLTKVPA